MTKVSQVLSSRVLGAGGSPALALHCTMAFSGAWSALSAVLSNLTITAPDLLNHGGSPDWDGQGDLFDRVTEASLPFLHTRSHIIGHSFGAMIALRLAVEHPDLVTSLTLIEPVFFRIAQQDAPGLLERHNDDAKDYLAAIQSGDYMLSARLFNRMWATDGTPRWPQIPENIRQAMARGVQIVPFCSDAIFDDTADLLNPDRLSRLSAPTLVLRGSLTHPIMATINDGLARRMQNAESVVVDGAGHMLPITHPKQTAAAMTAHFGW